MSHRFSDCHPHGEPRAAVAYVGFGDAGIGTVIGFEVRGTHDRVAYRTSYDGAWARNRICRTSGGRYQGLNPTHIDSVCMDGCNGGLL